MNQIVTKELERSSSVQASLRLKEDDESGSGAGKLSTDLVSSKQQYTHIPANTTNSSRKSSFSEFCSGTPPVNANFLNTRIGNNERDSVGNIMDEGISQLLRPLSTANPGHDFLKKNPKCSGAKFTGLPG